ncbi:MAG: VCBS repeat-containing protein [Bacteroidetes bacterium]|nr:VCBS repeat-containing protein [Bacteroidota bacterium]
MSRTKVSLISKIAVLVVYFLLVFIISRAQVTSDFSANADGWTIYTTVFAIPPVPVYNAAGGNPSGNISTTLTNGSTNFFWNAPAKFLGNLSRAYNQTISFDLLQSTSGTDNTNNDLEIIGGGVSIVYQLPTKPGTTWTHYAIQLNENVAGWHSSSLFGPAPTQIQMKQALSNVTSLRIRIKYNTTSSSYSGQLDNVVLTETALGAVPTITAFSPSSALPGTTVTIQGSNFNPTAAQNAVYFKGVKATVTSATTTQLTVTVPKSATFGPISVINLANGLQGNSIQSFNPLFDNNKDFGGRIIPASMSRGYTNIVPMSNSSNGFGGMDKGDIDGDGWIDMVVTETGSKSIYAYPNLGTGNPLSTASFGAAITLPSFSSIPGGFPSTSEILLADINNDGKLDLVAQVSSNTSGFFAVFQNTSTPGNISFAAPLYFGYPYYSGGILACTDLDGDGLLDLLTTTGTAPGNVWICQNLSTGGSVDFAYGSVINPASTGGYSDLAVGDLDGDGKPEVVAPGYNSAVLSIYKNNSTPGTISMASPFTIPAQVSYTVQLAMADLDADNKLDMVWSVYNASYVYFTKNISNGSVFDATSFSSTIQVPNGLADPSGISIGDINADGKPDVVMTGHADLGILQNVGAAGALSATSFSSPTLFQGSATGAYMYAPTPAIADFDGDNKPDVAMVYSNSSIGATEKGVYLFHNECFPVPSVTSSTPSSGFAASSVSLNGNLLETGNVNPTVRLNKIAASVSGSPTNTAVSVTIPGSAISGNFTVTNHGLTTNGNYFKSTFGTSRTINSAAFGPTVDFGLASGTVYTNLDLADFDDDGKMDLVIRDAGGTGIFQNSATVGQTITATSLTKLATTYSGGVNSFCFDFDGDGKVDLNNAYNNFQNTSSGSTISFATGVYTNANSFTGASYSDFNKDGKFDVALVNNSGTIRIYENLTSRGAFVNTSAFSTFSSGSTNLTTPVNTGGNGGLITVDFDGDGYDDVATITPSNNSFAVFKNMAVNSTIGASSFSAITTIGAGNSPSGITANDFDGDGKIDVAISNHNSTFISVYLNTSTVGTISFAAPVSVTCPTAASGIGAQDLDGDGKAELVSIHAPAAVPGSFSVFQNKSTTGALSFATGVSFSLARLPQAIAFADLNVDQKPDIIILATNGSAAPANAVMVFQNNIQPPVITISTQPTSVYSVCDGATPTITTAATGTTNITYQWQYSSDGVAPYTDLTNTGGYSNVATASFTINSTGNFGGGFYRCKVNGDFATTVYSNTVSFTVNALPTKPTTSDVSNCGPGSVVLTASGGSNGQYLWYDQNGLISGQNNNTYTTPSISTTSGYSVAITDGTCLSAKVSITATINSVPAAPVTQGASACSGKTISLNATGGTNGQYRWYTAASGGTAINGEVNSSYVTPTLTSTTTYYVSINNGTCESGRIAVVATVNNCAAPVIKPDSVATQIGGKITLDLKPLITTANLDLSSLQIITPPSSGASASIDANGILTIDYSGKAFSGTEKIKIQACDLNGQCSVQNFSINVAGDIIVYNGISPDGANPKLVLQYIEVLPETKNNSVYIFDRWENLVWHGSNYDNTSVVFTGSSDSGSALPSGVYFYKIAFASGRKTQTGFISLRR